MILGLDVVSYLISQFDYKTFEHNIELFKEYFGIR